MSSPGDCRRHKVAISWNVVGARRARGAAGPGRPEGSDGSNRSNGSDGGRRSGRSGRRGRSGTTYGGNGINTFALPDLRGLAPNNMTYSICDAGVFPARR